MKFIIRTLSVFIIFTMVEVVFAGAAFSQSKDAVSSVAQQQITVKIGVIDIEGIRARSLAVQDIHKQLTQYRNKIQSYVQKEEKDLRKANDELVRQRTILSPDAFEVEKTKFEKRLSKLQKFVQESKQSLSKVQAEANEKVDNGILGVIQEIIKKDNYTLILKKSATVASANVINLTDRVLGNLDKELPSVKVSDPTTK
ncbi:MAG: OmpH family outer membrane protein [Rhodospirillaceae bacterium]|nr:OmpH family outer membrane protein [Rhodospirillaceae bacterium]